VIVTICHWHPCGGDNFVAFLGHCRRPGSRRWRAGLFLPRTAAVSARLKTIIGDSFIMLSLINLIYFAVTSYNGCGGEKTSGANSAQTISDFSCCKHSLCLRPMAGSNCWSQSDIRSLSGFPINADFAYCPAVTQFKSAERSLVTRVQSRSDNPRRDSSTLSVTARLLPRLH